MIKSNCSFIYSCERCGRDDIVSSEIVLKFNYGSKYDGEALTLNICGDCADEIYNLIQNKGGQKV